MTQDNHHRIVIIGGGTAGISVAARLMRIDKKLDVALIEPSTKHYYQPMWTLVGGGDATKESTVREEASLIPAGVRWIQDRVTTIDPDAKSLGLGAGGSLSYDFLVAAPGLQLDWHKVKGLEGQVGKGGICSNYSYETVDSTWEAIRNFKSGNALFTHPNTPIKCGGAPQKIMYLAADHFRKKGILGDCKIRFGIASPEIFAVRVYAQALLKAVDRYGIEVNYRHDLVEVRPQTKEAVFKHLDTEEEIIQPYDLLHVTPPMSAPDFIKKSPLASAAGWIEVDDFTARHLRYDNVFALGDASSIPTSKTGAAIRRQAPVVVQNLVDALNGRVLSARYDGYTSCPLVTGYGKLVLAEFGYGGKLMETFPFDQSKERWSMYQLKKRLLPKLYWDGMMKGRA
ncbi:MAG: NAD(P)/FAD-dependent oxidoreductase [Planctomycetes bacterium]|nr:NAD(P)/FAD-dependent oxidoreductase [Planctomycetota bacterium]